MSSFPSLRITADGLTPKGSFAEAQATYLRPDARTVETLDQLLAAKKIGVVAHFYMDPELQGVLAGCAHPHIHVSDSLVMADRAVDMAKAGMERIVVLGVDFMSENARAMLDAAGYESTPVYRVAEEPIGCSLASSADSPAYEAYLDRAAQTKNAVHVVYINTSLVTKAKAHAKVPTITCTSSNVVQTVLSAFAQVDDVEVFFGPDTYMGHNLRTLFETLASLPDDQVRALHPAHTAATVRDALSRFHTFEEGACIVHHMFGHEVVERVRREHADAMITAHLEVPGEMFALGLEAQRAGRGVVGSTSDILGFMEGAVRAALEAGENDTLAFVLGTEAGMITPIVRKLEQMLVAHRANGGRPFAVDIVFPVASEALAPTDDPLGVIPGVASGEGCSIEGGCATCPYMKMNSLRALLELAAALDTVDAARLASFHPKVYAERVNGRTVADLGGEPILHMRAFGRAKQLPDALIADITSRH